MDLAQFINPGLQIVDSLGLSYNCKEINIDASEFEVIIIPRNKGPIKFWLYSDEHNSESYIADAISDDFSKLYITASKLKKENNFCLVVELPQKYLQKVIVNSENHDITIAPGVCIKDLVIHTISGYVESACAFKSATISSFSGTIDLKATAYYSAIDLRLSSSSGSIFADIANASTLETLVKTKTGKVRLHHFGNLGHKITGSIKTNSGNIRIFY